MAELVELRAEEWVPELEHMERIGLFNKKEIKSIATKKKELEYKIQRRSKSKEDFMKYIQFEVDLFRLIKARRDKLRIHSSKSFIEGSQTNRITRLFKQAIFRFQDDIKMWMSFFKYCQEANKEKLGSQMLVRMLQVHADKENLWSFAAKWDFEQLDSVETARQFLVRGIRQHPESELLYTELYKLELKYADTTRKEIEKKKEEMMDLPPCSNTEEVIKGRLAEVVYENAVTKIKNVDFKVALLNITSAYKWSDSIQNKIFQDLIKEHSGEEETWNVMAKREMEGLPCLNPEQMNAEDGVVVCEKEPKTLKERIQRSVNAYESAVQKLNTMKMWSYYLDHVIELNRDTSSLNVYRNRLLRNALEGAVQAGHIEERHYLYWIDILESVGGKQRKLNEVLTKATENHPKSLKLWHARLRFHLRRDQEISGVDVFQEAVKNLPEELPIWKLMIQYYQTKSSSKVEDIFRDGLARGGELALRLKPLYLRWVVLSKGIGSARTLFETPEMLHPPCLELYKKMIEFELMQPEMNKKVIRRCHELACNFAGENSLDVWVDYVEFELKHGDSNRSFQIYVRAVRTLNSDLVDEFVSQYNTLKMDT